MAGYPKYLIILPIAGLTWLLSCGIVKAQEPLSNIIPPDRRIDWNITGVPGGIPVRDTIGANVMDYNASASIQASSGSTVSGSNQIALDSTIDFKVGQGIRIEGEIETISVQVLTSASASGNIIITIDSWGSMYPVIVPVVANDSAIEVARKIRSISDFYAWTRAGTNEIVTFTNKLGRGPTKGALFNGGSTGVTAKVWVSTLGAYDLTSQVTAISAGTISLRDKASVGVNHKAVTHDDTEAFQNAIKACPDNQVVYIPQGQYRIRTLAILKSNITIRGAGADKTIIFPDTNTFNVGSSSFSSFTTSVTGASKGSSTLTFSNTAGLKQGSMISISRANEAGLVFTSNNSTDNRITQMAMVQSVDGAKVTISPALIYDFSDKTSIKVFNNPVSYFGLEDLKVDHSLGASGTSFNFMQCYACWASGIHSYKPGGFHSMISDSLNGEIRNSYFEDSKSYGSNNAGICMYPAYGANTAFRIENNMFFKTFPGIEFQNSTSGNYVGYNFGYDVEAGWNYSGVMFDDNHGAHNLMNLWEGNVGEMFQSDGYFGSSSHTTVFRNNFTADNPFKSGNFKAISLNRWAYYYNIVGNVLGSPQRTYDFYEASINGYAYEKSTIYQLGYPNMGNNGYTGTNPPSTDPQALDLKVKSTLLRWGNYDYYHKASSFDSQDIPSGVAVPANSNLPASAVYALAPSWWPKTVAWPPIGPDVNGLANKIPAQVCFENSHLAASGSFNAQQCYAKPTVDPNAGDVSLDGKVTIYDAVLVLRMNMGATSFSQEQMARADVNSDQLINQDDVILIVQKSLGLAAK